MKKHLPFFFAVSVVTKVQSVHHDPGIQWAHVLSQGVVGVFLYEIKLQRTGERLWPKASRCDCVRGLSCES